MSTPRDDDDKQLTPEEAAEAELARLRSLSARDDELTQARRQAELARTEAQEARRDADVSATAAAEARRAADRAISDMQRETAACADERRQLETERASMKKTVDEVRSEMTQLMHAHQQTCTARDEKEAKITADLNESRRLLSERESEARREAVKQESQLALVDEELQKARDAERAATDERERLSREEARNTVLLSLYRDQLAQKDADLEKLQAGITELEEERSALASDVRQKDDTIRELQTAAEDAQQEHASQVLRLQAAVEDASGSAASAAEAQKNAVTELDSTKQSYQQHMITSKKRERQAFETEVHLKQESIRLKDALDEAEGRANRAHAEAELARERHEQLASTLRGELAAAQKAGQEVDTKLSQQIAELRAEHEELKWKYARAEGQLKSSDRDSFDKIAALTEETDRLRAEIKTAQDHHRDSTEALRRQLVVVEAERDSTLRRVAELEQELESCEKKAKDASVLSWHEREQFKQLAQARGVEIEDLKKKLLDRQVAAESELRLVRKREHDARIEQRAELLSTEDSLRRLSEELHCVAVARNRAEQDGAFAAEAAAAKEAALTSQVATLEEQCRSRGEQVQNLEAQLVAQYDARALAQQNEELKVTVQTYKNQIATLNHTVAALRIEADIVDNHATKALQEANTQCVSRIMHLEERVEKQDLLLGDLVEIAEAGPSLTSTMRREISAWRKDQKQRGAEQARAAQVPLPPPHGAAATRPADEQRADVRSQARASQGGLAR
eukprot:TRINITY_DN553_c0_g2_i1.p1 TRINITY_DN553_c0_g2~~TRINITY_DN553_c0_g2_i1.p1  ORF type:complete len:763 (+),score=347.80 TRINITY_DN553_c0_g2_i1:60-2291(+)